MSKKKLLHIQLLPILSGAQNVMLNILSNLDRDKYEIFVISRSNGPLIEKLKEMKIIHLTVDSLRREISWQDLKPLVDIFRICKKYKFDIVHTHSAKPGFIGRIAARMAGVKKVIHTSHGYPFNKFQPASVQFLYRSLEAFAGLFCDYIVFVNNSDREMAIKKKLISKKKAITIYNGIDLSKSCLQQKKSNRFVIGSSFRFWDQKNPIQTIEIAIKVCRKNSKIDFIFLGNGDLLGKCKELVCEASLEKRIVFPGWQTNVLFWLKQFDAFLLFSKWEGLPISILEAMSIGLPIVASDISGNNELVSSKNGVLVGLNEVDKLVDVLINLPKRKSELVSWGAESRRFVEKNCSLQKFVSEYKRIYET